MRDGSDRFVRAVTDFIFVKDAPQPCDAIFIPGSLLADHVLKAAELYRAGYAPWVLPSGCHAIGRELPGGVHGYDTEWAWMRALLMENGVPDSAILREDEATFTWENAQLSRRVTEAAGIPVRRGMLCCLSFHARRALLYYQAAFPETEWLVCPAEHAGSARDDWFRTPKGRQRILGEVRRLGDQVNEVFELMMEETAPDRR